MKYRFNSAWAQSDTHPHPYLLQPQPHLLLNIYTYPSLPPLSLSFTSTSVLSSLLFLLFRPATPFSRKIPTSVAFPLNLKTTSNGRHSQSTLPSRIYLMERRRRAEKKKMLRKTATVRTCPCVLTHTYR